MARWKRISIELSHTWPGEAYLRFEAEDGTATMVRVDQDDLARTALLKNALGASAAVPDEDQAESDARKAASGPGWPSMTRPRGRAATDGAGREWVKDLDDRWWIEADGLWYPSFPETMGG